MKGTELRLIQYMGGSEKRFVIPVYQRNYDWKTENCKQLYDDLVKMIRNRRKSHFFGSLVSVYNPDGRNDEFLIIDGQQRLTTISLLFLAMHNLLNRNIITSSSPNLKLRIFEEYLVDKWQPQETRIKLKPVKDDCYAFAKLFDSESEHIKKSNLTINYNYYYDRVQKEEISVDELFDAICGLEIISITLNPDDNPQLIFESLNSTGVDLSEGDKIRNFILMGLPTKQQNDFYEKYWNRIEVCTAYDMSAFIRDYLSVKLQNTPSMNRIYFTFKAYVEELQSDIESLLQDLFFYAKQYELLLTGKTPNKRLNASICRLNRLETTITRPFFLEVLHLYAEGTLRISEAADIFLIVENYLFRRTICDLPTNALNKIFLSLHREIIRFDGSVDNYVEKFKYALLSKKDRARFPDNTEFLEMFEARPIYSMHSKNKIYILEKFENHDTIEDKDIYRHFDDGEYSIEHIMPQHLTPAWIKELGVDYELIHEQWLHRIANLTLTAYNSRYSNSSFQEKKDIRNGFLDSGIRMNQYIAQKEKWSLSELEERNQHLMHLALRIWPTPETIYKPAEKQLDTYTLDDEANLNGRIIARFSYKNTEQPVTSWVDMFEKVLKILHTEEKSILSRLAYINDDSMGLAQYVSDNPDSLRGYCEIDNAIYVEKNTSTWTKVSLLRRFFQLYNADPSDLVFYLRDESDQDEEALEGTRYELRRRFWAYALEYIKKANEINGAFANVNSTKYNWINGYFGISGFTLCCVANYDRARVELYLGRSTEENKAAFDHIAMHKSDIESSLGISLIWERGEEIKSSKVCHELYNVSIENETDWLQMTKFHAEWSYRFIDVIVPYLKELYRY